MKQRAISFIKKNGVENTHKILLKRICKDQSCSDFMTLLSNIIRVLDLVGCDEKLTMFDSAYMFERSQLTHDELTDLIKYT